MCQNVLTKKSSMASHALKFWCNRIFELMQSTSASECARLTIRKMLSFYENRIDNGAKANEGTQTSSMSHRNETQYTNFQNMSGPARATTHDHVTRTFRDRRDVRDDTLAHAQNERVEWNQGETNRFQAPGSSFFTTFQGHHAYGESQVHRLHQDSWNTQRAATYPSLRDWESVDWTDHRPNSAPGRISYGTESEQLSTHYPVTHGQEGYCAPFDRRSASFEQSRGLKGYCETEYLSRSGVAPPLQRFESLPCQWDTDWYSQQSNHFRQESAPARLGMVPVETSYPIRKWSIHSQPHITDQPGGERPLGLTVHANKHESFVPSREWYQGDTMKTSTSIEQSDSGQSESPPKLGLSSSFYPESVEDDMKHSRHPAQAVGHHPMISEEYSTDDEQAPAKRNKQAYDHRIDGNPSSLELLCSATLDLGPLQQNTAGCSCPRSNCIKLYCDCFKAGRRCSSECSCFNCKNTAAESGFDGERTRAIKNILARNPRAFTGGRKEAALRNPGEVVCNCVKSQCLKLYCECFQKNKVCNAACSCVSCLNTQEESHVGGRRKMAIQQALEKRPDAFTRAPKEVGSGCACKNNRCLKKYCDCFRFNLSCTDKCACKECENKEPISTMQVEQV